MRSFEIFVDATQRLPQSGRNVIHTPEDSILGADTPESGVRKTRPRKVIDVFLRGANVTARIGETRGTFVLRDLAQAVAELAERAHGKRIVRFYDDAWELALQRYGKDAAFSVYRTGADPEVLVYDTQVPFADVYRGVKDALDRARTQSHTHDDLVDAPAFGETFLAHDGTMPEAVWGTVEAESDVPISFSCDFAMRPCADDQRTVSTQQTDMHALLFPGRLRASVRGRSVELGNGSPFLFAERLVGLVTEALSAWERGQVYQGRLAMGALQLQLRGATDGQSALMLSVRDGGSQLTRTFPALDVRDVALSVATFARSLLRAVVRRDRSQLGNLRLVTARQRARELQAHLRDATGTDARINPAPESYRAFALKSAAQAQTGTPEVATRLRFSESWRAMVPGLDLRATFLCGERMILGAATETTCVDRTSGEIVWKRRTDKATSVVTPAGLARISENGAVCLHDFGSGEITQRAWIKPRQAGACSGAVVSAPGLPKLLVVTEGEQHLVALDLLTGEARWRYTWSRRSARTTGVPRLKRAGKLLYVASGDSSLSAIDVTTGACVFRVRERLRFRVGVTVDHAQLFAVAGGAGSVAELLCLDPFSGDVQWRRTLAGGQNVSVESPALISKDTVAVFVRGRAGLCAIAFDRHTGAPKFSHEVAVAAFGTSWLTVDDAFIGNAPQGELISICANTGRVRYRETFGAPHESDVPRRLEPVLRNGALFVPHVDVHVFRPHDGHKLSVLTGADAIPDLLRVDERCNVYIAEESGHVVSFGAGPRLSLVR
jgi:outer membrane protein assembly factor BamB